VLAPLAHLERAPVGEGEGLTAAGGMEPAIDARRRVGLEPDRLGPKEGLALVNGTQASTAVLALATVDFERVLRAADAAAALSIDALRGSTRPFDARIHDARPHPGQIASAAAIRHLM